MARVASRGYYEDEDPFGTITDGVKTGLGVAQAYHGIQGAKANKAFSDAQLEDFNRAEASRNAGHDASEAKSKNERVLSEGEYKTIIGTASSRLVSDAIRAKDPNDGIKMLEQNLRDVSDGNLDVKFNPITGPDGTAGGYAVDITTKGGRQTINVGSLQEFGGMLEKERKNTGFFTVGERDASKRFGIAQTLFSELSPEEQAQYGSIDRFIKDPTIRDHIDLMATKDLSYAEAVRTKENWRQGDVEHEQRGEAHRTQQETELLRQKSIDIGMQRERQGMGFDAQNQKYLVEVTREYDKKLKDAQLQNNEAAFYSTLSEAVEVRFPELQPTYVSTQATDGVDALAGLGVGAGTQKKQYSDEQLAKKKYIIQIHDTLDKNMALEQKFEVIEMKLAEQKKTPPPVDGDANQNKNGGAGTKDDGKKTPPPRRSGKDTAKDSASKPVPQPFNGAMSVSPPSANELAANSKRARESGEAISRGIRAFTEGQHTRDQREKDEEWRQRIGR